MLVNIAGDKSIENKFELKGVTNIAELQRTK